MKKSAHYRIFPELKITMEYLSGLVNLNEMVAHRLLMMADKDYDPGFNSITDFRNADFEARREDILKYAEFTKSSPRMLDKRKAAILANTPQQTYIAQLYSLNTLDLPFIIGIFYTVEAAMEWIDVPVRYREIIDEALEALNEMCKS